VNQPVASAGALAGQPGNGTAQTFVTNLYRELLGREPEAAGMAYWSGLLAGDSSAASRQKVALGFLSSPEYKTHFVTTLYENFLHRAPDPGGLQFYVDKLTANRDEVQILSYLVGSQEYLVLNGGTNQLFLAAIYRDLLGRATDSSAAYWVDRLQASDNRLSRDAVVRQLLFTPEGMHKLVDGDYLSLTGNTPTASPGSPQGGSYALANVTGNGFGNLFFNGNPNPAAVNAFLSQLQKGSSDTKNDQDAIAQLLASSEYFG
jgi:hypothetical protein